MLQAGEKETEQNRFYSSRFGLNQKVLSVEKLDIFRKNRQALKPLRLSPAL